MAQQYTGGRERTSAPSAPVVFSGGSAGARPSDVAPTEGFAGRNALLDAARARRSDLLVQLDARVSRVLPDDREGSRHQRFLLRIDDLTVLVAHNLDLADRVPLERGDSVTVRGEYEWNPKGGVLHWTHDDPAGRHPAGYVRHGGRLYQ
ncbi:MAG: DUF3465 domain-containing protein [Gemmatimonadales bacterium]|nr:DUF3465 domain-containing protein [Gemmatimonadales bacterium]